MEESIALIVLSKNILCDEEETFINVSEVRRLKMVVYQILD